MHVVYGESLHLLKIVVLGIANYMILTFENDLSIERGFIISSDSFLGFYSQNIKTLTQNDILNTCVHCSAKYDKQNKEITQNDR